MCTLFCHVYVTLICLAIDKGITGTTTNVATTTGFGNSKDVFCFGENI